MTTPAELVAVADAIFARLCHQDPRILMIVDGNAVPLCPRCLGLQLGFALSCSALTARAAGRCLRPTLGAAICVALALGAMLIDWGLGGRAGVYAPTVTSRLLTGLGAGSALAVPMLVYRQRSRRPREISPRDLRSLQVLGLVGISGGVGGLLLTFESWISWTLLSFICVLGNLLFVAHTTLLALGARIFAQPLRRLRPRPERPDKEVRHETRTG